MLRMTEAQLKELGTKGLLAIGEEFVNDVAKKLPGWEMNEEMPDALVSLNVWKRKGRWPNGLKNFRFEKIIERKAA